MVKQTLRNTHQPGVSLVEMLISLAIFSIIVFPMISIPMRAVNQSEQAKNGSLLQFEIQNFFQQFHTDVNQSYRFFPFWEIAKNLQLDMPQNQFVFLAYWDPMLQTEKRMGYQLKQIDSNSGKWQLLWTDISADAELNNYQSNSLLTNGSPVWKPATKVINTKDYYLTGMNNTNPLFVYCRGNDCGTSASPINPKEADSIRIQSGTPEAPLGINFIYKNAILPLHPLYFRLASLETKTNRDLAETQIYPFSMVLNRWGINKTWMGEKTQRDITGVYNTPIVSVSDLSNASPLSMNDFHYNYKSGELLAVSNSPATEPESQRGFYIFKFRPGFPNYKSYHLTMATGDSYINTFPIKIYQNEPGWIPYQGEQWIGITEDNNNNIYVLAKTNGQYLGNASGLPAGTCYWVEKFSSNGTFLSRFNITTREIESATGIAYNPAAPNEIDVLIQKGNGSNDLVIRAYPDNQNNDNPNNIVFSAESIALNQSTVSGNYAATLSQYGASGLEYDPLHNRIMTLLGGNGNITILSFDMDLSSTHSQPSVKLASASAISTPVPGFNPAVLSSGPTSNHPEIPIGIAYDPLNNYVFLSTIASSDNLQSSYYYRILPDVRLNRVYQ